MNFNLACNMCSRAHSFFKMIHFFLVFQEMGGKLKELEEDLKKKQTDEVKCTSQYKALKDSIKDENKKKNQVEKNLKEVRDKFHKMFGGV